MRIGLGSRWFPEGTSLAEAARRTRDLGLNLLSLAVPGTVVGGERADLKAVGVDAGGVLLEEGGGASTEDLRSFAAALTRAAAVAGALRAPAVVVDGGGLGTGPDRRLRTEDRRLAAACIAGSEIDVEAVERMRGEFAEAAAERAVRALHAASRTSVPLALRNGGGAACLFGIQEVEWVLDELPRVALYFDPTRALRRQRLGLDVAPAAWAERFANRTAAVLVQGLGSDLAGGSHPEDDGAAWRELAGSLPRAAPWILQLTPVLSAADVEDAVRYVETEIGR